MFLLHTNSYYLLIKLMLYNIYTTPYYIASILIWHLYLCSSDDVDRIDLNFGGRYVGEHKPKHKMIML